MEFKVGLEPILTKTVTDTQVALSKESLKDMGRIISAKLASLSVEFGGVILMLRRDDDRKG